MKVLPRDDDGPRAWRDYALYQAQLCDEKARAFSDRDSFWKSQAQDWLRSADYWSEQERRKQEVVC